MSERRFCTVYIPSGRRCVPALQDMTSPALGGWWACPRPLPALGVPYDESKSDH